MPTTIRIPLSRPDLSETEIEEVLSVLRTPWLSMGPKLLEFEKRFAAFIGVRHAVAVSSGTAGLHLALRAVGVRSGVDVITTPFTFVATINPILFERATPVFVDVDPHTLNLTPDGVQAIIDRLYVSHNGQMIHRTTGAPLAAILPVSVFGHPVEIEGLRSIAQVCGTRIVDDTCEAFGSLYWSRGRGEWISEAALADAAVFAFYPNKQLTTGEGGMVVTGDDEIAMYCRMARNQGRHPDAVWLQHEMLGFNYRMGELSAALGIAQLRRAPDLLARRTEVERWYTEALADVEGIEPPLAAAWARVSWFQYVVRLRRGVNRNAVIDNLASRGIAAKPYFPPVHLQPHLRILGWKEGDFPVAEDVASRTIALPFFTTLTQEQVGVVVGALKDGLYASTKEALFFVPGLTRDLPLPL